MAHDAKNEGRPCQGTALSDADDHFAYRTDDGPGELFAAATERTETRDVETLTVSVDAAPSPKAPKPPKRGSQNANILAFLSRPDRPRLNQIRAAEIFQCLRLASRINELRKAGHDIRIDESFSGPLAHYYLAGE